MIFSKMDDRTSFHSSDEGTFRESTMPRGWSQAYRTFEFALSEPIHLQDNSPTLDGVFDGDRFATRN